jgi:hypothetical protein
MAQIAINIPDAQINRVLDAFADRYGWTSENSMNKAAFAKDQLKNFIKRTIKDSEGDLQAASLRAAINNDVDGIALT